MSSTIQVSAAAVYVSTNGGVSGSEFYRYSVKNMVIDPTHPNQLFLATRAFGVELSLDGGVTFTNISHGLSDRGIDVLAIEPTQPSTVYAGTRRRGLFVNRNAASFEEEPGDNTEAPSADHRGQRGGCFATPLMPSTRLAGVLH